MTKKEVYAHSRGSAEFVIAHGLWKKQRGKNPSMPYKEELNPRKALIKASIDLAEETKDAYRQFLKAIKEFKKTINEWSGIMDNISERNESIEEGVKNNYPFSVIIGSELVGEFPSFEEAYEFFRVVMDDHVEKNGVNWPWLETTNFISHIVNTFKGPVECALDFYQVRDLAYNLGLQNAKGDLLGGSLKISPLILDMMIYDIYLNNIVN